MSVFGVILVRIFPHFPAFGPNTEKYEVSLRIQSECGKMRSRITPNTGPFYAMKVADNGSDKTDGNKEIWDEKYIQY